MRWNDEVAARTLAYVLAGGAGRRLDPLTRYRPKPLVPFGGCFRILDFALSNCLNSELDRAYVLTQHQCEAMAAYLKKAWSRVGASHQEFAIATPAIGGKRYAGTADAILQNLHLLQKHDRLFALVISADHVYKMDYRKLLSFHAASGADVTIATVDYPEDRSSEMGILEIDEDHRVVAFEEKPRHRQRMKQSATVLVNMGVYVFNYETLAAVESTGGRPLDIAAHLIPYLLRSRKVNAYRYEDRVKGKALYWRDVGTLGAYYDASMDLLLSDRQIDPYSEDWPIRSAGGARLGRGAISDAGSKIEVNSVIPHGADIADANVYHSVLSPGVVLESGVDVRHSVLLPGTVIKRGAVVRRAIIDAHVIVEAGDQIGYGTERDQSRFHVLPNGIVVVSPDHSLTAGGITKVENYSSGESHEVPEALTDAGSVVNPHRLRLHRF
ncbi:MAG TPA: sugar phosphate nucleotidyltransferase [Terriglobia bacterium]|nr:sugar phosphate nucleotidyltransferase [Terriglobia bacterium]